MKKLLNNPWFSGLLGLLAILVVAQSILPRSSRQAALEDPSTVDPALVGTSPNLAEALASLQITSAIRDPFAPHAVAAEPTEKTEPALVPAAADSSETLRLTAIWRQDKVSFALLNGIIRSSGEQIGAVVLESIQMDGIWVTHLKGRDFIPLGATFTLTLPSSPLLSARTDS